MTLRRRYRISSWLLLLETASCLVVAAAVKRILPFRLTSRILGRPATTATAPGIPGALRGDLQWAFGVFQRRWPFPPLCLTEVMALAAMLRRRALRGSAFLGVATGHDGMEAHAWMKCGNTILPRRQDLSRYRRIAIFE